MAQTVEAEKDPVRKERLRTVFSNVLALRKLAENCGSVNLGPATEALQVKLIRALSSLQDQLTIATFACEQARVVLISERDFVSDYVDILGGMVEAEKLAKTLADMDTSGQQIGALVLNVGDLTKQAEEFGTMMNAFADKLADSIESETARMVQNTVEPAELKNVDLDKEIQKYAKGKYTK